MTALDPGRVARSLALDVEELDDGVFRVTGGREPHTVERDGDSGTCDCADAHYRRGPCKHTVAVHLHRRLDRRVIDALSVAVGAA